MKHTERTKLKLKIYNPNKRKLNKILQEFNFNLHLILLNKNKEIKSKKILDSSVLEGEKEKIKNRKTKKRNIFEA